MTIDGKYIWVGGLGAVFESHEWQIDFGNVRYIEGHLFKANIINSRWFGYIVGWNFVDSEKNDSAFILEFKKQVFWD